MKNSHPQNSEVSALDQRDFNPNYPSHNTQAARLLAVSLLGQKINPLHAWVRLGIYRLSDTKYRLKEMGWPMDSGRLDVANKFGEACHVALYGLPAWAIEAAGDLGKEFAQREMELMDIRSAA
ncbi:MAG: Helix-turn-helix domain [Pseudomonadota bacterium]|jgi:hypothetical protein